MERAASEYRPVMQPVDYLRSGRCGVIVFLGALAAARTSAHLLAGFLQRMANSQI